MKDESDNSNDSQPQGNVISDILKICSRLAYVLLDTGADYSFISNTFIQKLKSPPTFEM